MSRTALAAVALVALLPGTAHAQASGTLTFAPGSGLDTTRIRVVTSAPCPEQTTNMVAVATGKGFPSEGEVVVTNNDIDFSRSAPFAVGMTDTMAGFAANSGTTLSGRYRITLKCIDITTTVAYASFSGVVTFGDSRHWTAPTPSRALAERVAKGQAAGLGTALPHGASASPRPSGVFTQARPTRSADAVVAATAVGGDGTSPGTDGTSLLWYLGLSVAGTGLMAFGIGTWRRERRSRSQVPQ